MTVTASRTMGHVDEVNPPDLAAQPSMISLKCQIPRFGRNPDAVSTVSNLPQHASLLHRLATVHFRSRSKALDGCFSISPAHKCPAADKTQEVCFQPTPLVWKITLP